MFFFRYILILLKNIIMKNENEKEVEKTGVNDGYNSGIGLSGSSAPIETMYFHGDTIVTKDEPHGVRFTIAGYIIYDELILGISLCSKNDIFSKARGRTISRGRVLHQILRQSDNTSICRGVSAESVYGFKRSSFKTGNGSFPANYYKGNEIKVFREYIEPYTFLTKKELMEEFNFRQ